MSDANDDNIQFSSQAKDNTAASKQVSINHSVSIITCYKAFIQFFNMNHTEIKGSGDRSYS